MKTGTSSLNPYAASYIPLARRGTDDANKDYSSIERGCKGGNETTWSGPQSVEATQNQYQSKASQNYGAHGKQSCENYALQGNPVHGSYGASSQNSKEATEKQIPDEEYDMDLAYLQMTFPGISYESLSAVYFTNSGDLDATIDMLNHFELDPDEYSENLMHAFNIGDVSESGSPIGSASLKLKKVAGEGAGSSSSTSESAHVT